MSIRALRRLQLGLESTPGTAVAATARWRGSGLLEDASPYKFSEEDVAYVSGLDRSYKPGLLAKLAMQSAPLTFEQFGYVGAAGIKNVVSGSADGSGSDFIYAYTFPTTAVNTIKTYTIETGDDQQEEEAEYCFVEGFKITGKPNEALMLSADWLGRQVSPSSFTGSLSLVAVEEVLFNKGKLYIDAVGGTIGGTQKSSTFIGMQLSVKTGAIAVFTGDGSLYFTFHKMTMPEVLLDITFEHDSTSVTEKANWRAQTARQIRLDFDGNALTTPGTSFSTKKFRIDLAGKWEKFDVIDEINGNDIVKGTFRARYNATAALFAEIKVVNESSALA